MLTVAGLVWDVVVPAPTKDGELQRNTLENDFQKEAEALGIAAILRE